MKLIKKVLFVLLSIIALWLVVALFVENEFTVNRTVEIEQPSDNVFEYARHLKNQEDYGVWHKMDQQIKTSYSGTDGEVGFVSRWESKNENVGTGEQEITEIIPGSKIETELRFKKPMEQTNTASITIDPISDSKTKVTWSIHGEVGFPWNAMLLFMDMDEMLGKDLNQGLTNMKSSLESVSGE